MSRIPAPRRFVGMVASLVIVFGAIASLGLGALDKAQNNGAAGLFNLGALLGYDLHFLQVQLSVIFTQTDNAGTPFHNYVLKGVATTIEFCFISMPIALALGLILALMSRSPYRVIRVPARAYVEFFRNTPLLVQMQAIYISLQFLSPIPIGIATLVLNYAAYECENLRTGLAALDKGQGEAAATLGLSYPQTFRLITYPQIVSVVLPPVINDLIYMFKDSSILSLITIFELTEQTQDLVRRFSFVAWQLYFLAAVLYLLLSLPLARVARGVEARLKAASFQPRFDLANVSVAVLGGMIAVGWICGVIVKPINPSAESLSPGVLGTALADLLAAVVLSIGVTVGFMVGPGGLVYLVGALIRAVRRSFARPARRRDPEPGVALSR